MPKRMQKNEKQIDNSGFVKNKICKTIWWLDQMNHGHYIAKKVTYYVLGNLGNYEKDFQPFFPYFYNLE